MDSVATERALIVVCSGFQGLVAALLLHSVMSNMAPVGIGYWLGLGTGSSAVLALGTMTLCAAFGSSARVVKASRYLMLLPIVIFVGVLIAAAAT